MQKDTILVIGAAGQVGSELVTALQEAYGQEQVIATDIRKTAIAETSIFEVLNVMDKSRLYDLVKKYQVTQIYQMVAMLSAKGEQNPLQAWKLNTESLLNVLELAREKKLAKVYFPSSIAVFGANTPKQNTPQHTLMEPSTVYGFSKLALERWCAYYFQKYQVDVRSLRYPGLISYKTQPGGGSTDYAIEIYYQALEKGNYTCFLGENTSLPMMYMPDAIQATLQLMEAPTQCISVRSSYNLTSMTFSPKEQATSIQKYLPHFQMFYSPDFRQAIVDTWPQSIDDSRAKKDWGWQPAYDLDAMTEDMLKNIRAMKERVLS